MEVQRQLAGSISEAATSSAKKVQPLERQVGHLSQVDQAFAGKDETRFLLRLP